jgi:hypothetical protein
MDSSRLSEDKEQEEEEEQSEKELFACGEEDFEVWKIVNNQEHFEFVNKLQFKYVWCSLVALSLRRFNASPSGNSHSLCPITSQDVRGCLQFST